MKIRLLQKDENPPWNLLLLADPSKELVTGYLQNGLCFIAQSESEVIGVALLLPQTKTIAEIVNLAVKEGLQGKGIGKLLIKHSIQAAQELGFTIVEIGTGNSSINQLAMYQKAGFRITGIDHDYFIRNYHEPIFENGIQCRDMILLSIRI